jgi:hypothetical protein
VGRRGRGPSARSWAPAGRPRGAAAPRSCVLGAYARKSAIGRAGRARRRRCRRARRARRGRRAGEGATGRWRAPLANWRGRARALGGAPPSHAAARGGRGGGWDVGRVWGRPMQAALRAPWAGNRAAGRPRPRPCACPGACAPAAMRDGSMRRRRGGEAAAAARARRQRQSARRARHTRHPRPGPAEPPPAYMRRATLCPGHNPRA